MEKETKEQINDNGSYTKVTVQSHMPEDGPVSMYKEFAMDHDKRGKYLIGHMKKVSIATNDPKVTRPFVRIICGIFLGVGILQILLGLLSFRLEKIIFGFILGSAFVATAVVGYIIAERDISRIEEELKRKQNAPGAPQNGNTEK